jgi:hypothetical protein
MGEEGKREMFRPVYAVPANMINRFEKAET